jgi:hypothetical protein
MSSVGELRDLVTLSVGLSAYRLHIVVFLPMQRLWKFYDSEGLDLGLQY